MLKLNNLSGGGSPEAATAPPSVPGNLYVWGSNDSGQLGLGDFTVQNTPTLNSAITQPIFKGNVSGGSLSVFISNNVVNLPAGGENTLGQLGDGTLTDQSSFVDTSVSDADITFINSGGDYSIYSDGGIGTLSIIAFAANNTNTGLRLTGSGTSDWTQEVDCWAWVDGNFDGSGTMELTTSPSVSSGNRGAVGIFFPSLSITDDPSGGRTVSQFDASDILFWDDSLNGDVVQGLVGITIGGNFRSGNFDQSIKISKVVAISSTTTLSLNEEGGGFSFSSNNQFGEAGQNAGGGIISYGVFKVGFESGVTDIAGNEFNSFMIKDGAIFASGSYQTGCVGLDPLTNLTNILNPIQLGTATDWVEIQAGENCLIARNASNELWFIGNNTSSQKGVAPDGITTELTLVDSPNTYSAYLVTARSVYGVRE